MISALRLAIPSPTISSPWSKTGKGEAPFLRLQNPGKAHPDDRLLTHRSSVKEIKCLYLEVHITLYALK